MKHKLIAIACLPVLLAACSFIPKSPGADRVLLLPLELGLLRLLRLDTIIDLFVGFPRTIGVFLSGPSQNRSTVKLKREILRGGITELASFLNGSTHPFGHP